MRRSLLLLTAMALALLVASSVAQAASPTARCLQEAQSLTGTNLTGSNVVVGNNKRADDFSSKATTAGTDVFCGFGGDDWIDTLDAGDIFIGGAGNDTIYNTNNGTFYGGAGDDTVGGGGSDAVNDTNNGTFYGGDGRDVVYTNNGTFYGGGGGDFIVYVAWSTNPIIL